MNAKQEILDALGIAKVYLDADQPFTAEARLDRIRAILETHELVPVDLNGRGLIEEIDNISHEMTFPWPATQSDGEALLRLLGVLG